jgi:hypothetical protein
MPSCVLPPFLEVGRAALWQIVAPRRVKRRARRLKACCGAVPLVAGIAARIEAANPLPLIGRRRGARALDDYTDSHSVILDVPGLRPVVDALAGEGGHGGIEAQRLRLDNRLSSGGRGFAFGSVNKHRGGDHLHLLFLPQLALGFLAVFGDVVAKFGLGKPLVLDGTLRRDSVGDADRIGFAVVHPDHGGHDTIAPDVHQTLGFLGRRHAARKQKGHDQNLPLLRNPPHFSERPRAWPLIVNVIAVIVLVRATARIFNVYQATFVKRESSPSQRTARVRGDAMGLCPAVTSGVAGAIVRTIVAAKFACARLAR